MKKKILIIGLILLVVTGTVFGIISYADNSMIHVSLSETYLDQNGNSLGIGYGIGDASQLGSAKIWHLATYASASETAAIAAQRNLYCIKANHGDTWNADKTDKVTYNLSYDMQAERKAVFDALTVGTDDGNSIVKDILDPSKEAYRQILWILDNSFVEGKNDIAEFLAKAGIVWDERYQVYAYEAVDGYDYEDTVATDKEYSTLLTAQDINAVQKAAIWYYTNYVLDKGTILDAGGLFNKKSNTDWLNVTTDDGATYNPLSSTSADRDEQARILYNYLIDAAENNKTLYTASNNYTIPVNSLKVNNLELEVTPSKTYDLATQKSNNHLLAGPINIATSNDGEYDINLSVTNTAGNTIEYQIVDQNGQTINYESIKDLVDSPKDLYIKVSTSVATEFNIAISTTTESTSKTIWLDGEETEIQGEDAINLPKEQPIVEVNRTTETKLIEFFAKPEKEKEFDLALRKYITKINNTELATLQIPERIPTIPENAITSGTTATYKHKKDPVFVETGDIVTYQIRIYNEGEKKGYASQIVDQLPAGLIYNPSSKIVSKDSAGNDKNEYTVTYDTQLDGDNKIVFDIVNTAANPAKDLNVYEAGKIDYETLEIQCKVIHTAQAGKTNILTNVAWISGAYDTTDSVVATDRDSQTAPENSPNVKKDDMENYKGHTNNKNDLTDSTYFYKGQQDDDDFEKLYVQIFDLSLRKFISAVDGIQLNGRAPVVDVSPLTDNSNTTTTAIYNHPKTPVASKVGDKIVYTIRIYNEGEIDGYASEVKDYLPPHLEFVKDSQLNIRYGWSISQDGRIATTTHLADKKINKFNGTALEYRDVQIECKILDTAVEDKNITNIAEISEYKYGNTVVPKDIDSTSDNMKTENNIPADNDLPDYKKDEENKQYVPGNEDDDDFEKVYVNIFDLALRKFITKVQDTEVTTRVPQVKIENGKISYEHPKDPVLVHVGDRVEYTIRVYNEGEINGYASEIADDMPEYLEYLPQDTTNTDYMWKMYDKDGKATDKLEEAVRVKTEFLAMDNNKQNLLVAFDGTNVAYKDIKIAFKVKDPNSNQYIITNHAEIADDTDEYGDEIKDKDSIPDQWNENEDDQDIENVKVQYFDLALLKYVTKVIVIEDGTEKITETGYNGLENPEPVVKVELHRKKLSDVVVKFGYGIKITNEGDIAGYAKEITDYIPQGLKFVAEDNPTWKDEGNNVISTKQLEETLLQPGESATVEVILTWINGEDNLMEKTNTAEISIDDNEYDVPDKDSTPDNKKEGEDDIDIAKVILTISTGAVKTYFGLTLVLLSIIALGIILIKRFIA